MADVCTGYNYALAGQDVVPIVLGAIGFLCLAKRIEGRFPELKLAVYFAATILVIGSAFAGPIRKTLLAGGAECNSLDWMQIPFFSSMPIGFGILCWAVLCLLRDRKVSFLPFGLAIAALFLLASLITHAFPLVAVGGLFAIATGVECALLARRERATLTAVLFVLYAISISALPAFGSNDHGGAVSQQWLEQGTNTVAQALFAVATFRLLRAYQRTGTRSVLVEN